MSQATPTVEFFTGLVPVLNKPMAIVRVTAPVAKPDLQHDVLVLDCSGSMYDSLESVKLDARTFVATLDDSHFVSVVVFSGHGTAKRIAGPVRCDTLGKGILDQAIKRDVYIMNTTVFSEPLDLVLENLRQAQTASMASQAILFTDGCAVPTKWGIDKEEDLALQAAYELYEFGAAVSVIGYGYHYDATFVAKLMAAGGYSGIFRHMNDVGDFAEVIADISTTFRHMDTTTTKFRVSADGSVVQAVYRAVPEVIKSSHTDQFIGRGLYDGVATYYLELSALPNKMSFTGFVGEKIHSELGVTPSALSAEQMMECIRVIAANAALSGDNAYAIELLEQTSDEGVAESIGEAYTESERRTNADRIRRAFRDRKFIGTGLKPTGPNHCVINVLRILMEDPSVIMSIPAGFYTRGGILVQDPRVVRSPLGSTVRVVSYTSHAELFNFSLTTQVDVSVYAVDEEGTILTAAKPTKQIVHRTYNIIRDGELVMKELLASMSEASFDQLQAAGVIDAHHSYKAGLSYSLCLGDMKMVSSAWARPSSLRLVDLLREEADLKLLQTALNARIKALGKPEVPEFDERGVYREKAKPVETVAIEYYRSRCMKLSLVKYKPAATEDISGLTVDQATARVKQVRQRLRAVRFLARSIAYACELTGWQSVAWAAPKTTARGKDSKQEFAGHIGSVDVKRVTWTTEIAYS